MDVRTNSEYLEFLARHLDEFMRAFEEFMTLHVENSGFGGRCGNRSCTFQRKVQIGSAFEFSPMN